MKLAIPVFTVVAVILAAGAPPASAQAPGATPVSPAFVDGPDGATFSGFIGDKPAEEEDAISPYNSTFTGYIHDGGLVRGKAATRPSVAKGQFVSRVRSSSATVGKHEAIKGDGIHQKGSKGAYGYPRAERSWLYDPWVGFEYMSAWMGERGVPPLVSTSPPGSEGVLPGADVLFGLGVGGDSQPAGRLTIGAWLGPNRRAGIVGRFFATESEITNFQANSDSSGVPVLARPFYETWDGSVSGVGPAAYQVAGVRDVNGLILTVQGNVNVHSETEVLGADAYVRYMLHCRQGRRVDLIAGYQFSRIDDTLTISNVSNITPPIIARVEAEDGFETTNKFHGGQIGLLGEMDRGPLTLSLLAKVGLGNMNEVVTISGQSRITDLAGGVSDNAGGILALPSNIGTYKKDKFTVIPELEAKATWRLTRNLDFSVGYTLMYWNDLALAGDQIETYNGLPVVNSSQWFGGSLDGPANPNLVEIVDTDLFMHALNVGFTIRL